MIKVLIVDDSRTTREYIKYAIESDPTLILAGEAANGREAVQKVEELAPDVVIMDIQMPGMNGYESTRAIMERTPVPIVVHSTLVAPEQSDNIFEAMQAGAVAVAEKPPGIGHPDSERLTGNLLRIVKLMSEVKVVKRKSYARKIDLPPQRVLRHPVAPNEAIGIGASTGGPPVLHAILTQLHRDFPLPIFIVQHISKGFLPGMLHWLSKETELILKVAKTGEHALPGHVYFAPEETNMAVNENGHILLTAFAPGSKAHRPITYLFDALARVYGKNGLGILLTGMGNDGAIGLKAMKTAGATTIVQDRESSVIFSMPAEAMKLDAVDYTLAPNEIVSYLNILAARAQSEKERAPLT